MWLHRLDDADASCGGKAVGLARLIAAGLPVPDGFVIDDRAFRHVVGDLDPASEAIGHALAEAAQRIATAELPVELVREVEARAAALGVLAVRSSATIEDGEAGAAAGVFSSRTAVPPAEVWAAIRAVWTSALTPLAVTYARRRGGRIAIGVIVQRFEPGTLATIYTRTLGVPTSTVMMIQRGAALHSVAREAIASTPDVPAGLDALRALALRAEAAIGATGGADLEIVESAPATLWMVQARPMVLLVTPSRRPAPPSVIAPLVADGRKWTWDVAHNPDPLSPAQAGLVGRVDRAEIAPWSLRVCGGFLYAAPREDAKPHDVAAPKTVAALDARVSELEAVMQAALDGTSPTNPRSLIATHRDELDGRPSLDVAIERYVAFYAIWATELAPLIAAARANLSPAQLEGARPSAVEATLFAAARGELDERTVLDRIGVLSPAWDVSVPTFAERPELVRAAIDRARDVLAAARPLAAPPRAAAPSNTAEPPNTAASPSTAPPITGSIASAELATDTFHHHARVVANEAERVRVAQLVSADPARHDTAGELLHHHARAVAAHAERDLARAAADLGERDDVWFARAQWLVRRAILDRARELAIDPDDAFWIPLDELATATALDAEDLRRRASGARAAATRAAQWAMPIAVGGEADEGERPADRALHGVGTGPRVTGRVVRFETLASVITVTTGDVVVTRAVTPALAVLVIGCAALVSETGGLLDHGAALARELGIPCVVGCVDAWQLTDGAVVTVDGAAGTVELRPT